MTARIASVLLLALIVSLAPVVHGARSQAKVEEPAITGVVLAPDGAPVARGTIVVRGAGTSSTVPVDSTGRFRVVPSVAGVNQLLVNVPGLLPLRLTVVVPSSRSMRLPVIRLSAGAYVRVRLVAPDGQPLLAARLQQRLFDASGEPIASAGGPPPQVVDSDGAIGIGPLPTGIMTWAVDTPPFARTRLPDVTIQRPIGTLDAGTIAIQQPGATLDVDLVDGAGAAVQNHVVFIEEVRPRSPLAFRLERTNAQGRTRFDRLAAGQYRVFTMSAGECAGMSLLTSRVVAVAANATSEARFVIGGAATVRIASPSGPAAGLMVSASPNVPTPQQPLPFRTTPSGCQGVTDGSGRVTLTGFPPGPAHIDVRVGSSTYVRQVDVPTDGQDVAVAMPDGFLPVRVVNDRNAPVAGALIAWESGGARVQAAATATGDALLEAVGRDAGALTVSAPGYQRSEESFAEPPGVLHAVVLARLPQPTRVRVRVRADDGTPIPDAVVASLPIDTTGTVRIVTIDDSGAVTVDTAASEASLARATADGFVPSTMRIEPGATGEALLVMSRGYRAVVDVEAGTLAGPLTVRVLDASGRAIDDFLDAESDRRTEPGGQLSLGPLAPGTYAIELRGGSEIRRQPIRIVDRDVQVAIR